MKSTIKKIFFFFIIPITVIGVSVGYYLYNKGPVDVKLSAGIKISAEELYTIFSTDSITAQKKYSNEILKVAGQVNAVTINTENKQIVTLITQADGAFINCVMEENALEINPGEKIKIKGICSGIGQGEPELGIKGDVYLSRCFSIK